MMTHDAMARAWDRASADYLARRVASYTDVSYGNLAPFESELHLLGELGNRRVLDLGCGGGHNAVACAQRGAVVTGVDVSDIQLRAARALAISAGVGVVWVQGDAATYAPQQAGYDVILAVQLLSYVADMRGVLEQCRALLAAQGRLVVSFDHPLRTCFIDPEDGDLAPYPMRSYGTPATLVWEFSTGVPMRTRHLPLGLWLDALADAGFRVIRLVEPQVPEEVCNELWPEDGPLAPLRYVPHTAIVVAEPMLRRCPPNSHG